MKIKVKGILAAATVCGADLMVNQLTANAADQQVAPAKLTASVAVASGQTSSQPLPAAPASQVAPSTVNAVSQPAATPITANSDTGNYGNLDGAAIVGNQVRLQGWNANGQAGQTATTMAWTLGPTIIRVPTFTRSTAAGSLILRRCGTSKHGTSGGTPWSGMVEPSSFTRKPFLTGAGLLSMSATSSTLDR